MWRKYMKDCWRVIVLTEWITVSLGMPPVSAELCKPKKMSTSNTSLLTRSHAVYSAKKRAKKAQIQEVVFDEDARR